MLPWAYTRIGVSTTKNLGRTHTGLTSVESQLQKTSSPWTYCFGGDQKHVEFFFKSVLEPLNGDLFFVIALGQVNGILN